MKKKPVEIKLRLDPNLNKDAKNLHGQMGAKCNNCGGYGFTMSIQGAKITCQDCQQTGVRELTNRELQQQIISIGTDLQGLRQALVETLESKGLMIKTDPRKGKNAGK
jgi:hypothetical protein